MKYFKLIWAGLWRKKARTILTMLSIIVAFLLFGLLQGINSGFNAVVENLEVDRLYVSAKTNMTDGLPYTYAAKIRSLDEVETLSLWTFFGGYYQDARTPLPAFATDASELFTVYKEIKINPEYIQAMERTRTGVLLSDQLAQRHGWKPGDRIQVGTTIWTNKEGSNTWMFDVVGTFDASAYGVGFPSFYLNYDYFDEAASFGNGTVHYFIVKIKDPMRATQVSQQIDALFENSSTETRTMTESGLAQANLQQVGDINFIVNSIVGAVLFTLLFLTANTMMQSVRERTPELAVLKTLGYSDTKVLVLVVVESVLLCVAAALVGLALATAVFPSLTAVFGDLSMPMIVVGMGVAIAVALALISGLPPALRAKRLNIVDALAGR